MAAGSIVKDFDVIKDVGACELARFVVACMTNSVFRLLKKLSIGALTLLCQVLRIDSAKSAKISGYSSRTM